MKWYCTIRRKFPWWGNSGPDGSTVGLMALRRTKVKERYQQSTKYSIIFRHLIVRSLEQQRGQRRVIYTAAKTKKQLEEEDSKICHRGAPQQTLMVQQTHVESLSFTFLLKWMSSYSHSPWFSLDPATAEHDYCMITIIACWFDDYNGIVPTTMDELMKIEGIGW